MQIDRLNHLLFPPDSKLPPGKDASTPASAAPAARVARTAAAEQGDLQSLPVLSSVVLSIQSDAGSPAKGANAVYEAGRKAAAPSDNTDTDRMAAQHQKAIDRQAGVQTRIAVDKDGVLVAKPAAKDFVTHAVSAMREYADEMERLKAARAAQEGVSAGALRALQQISTKLKAFAHV